MLGMSTKGALSQLEAAFRRNGYEVRYMKGPFRGGACRVIDRRLVVINSLYPPAGRLRLLASAAAMVKDRLDLTPEEVALIERYAL